MRLTGFDLDSVKGRDGTVIVAKKQPPSLVTKFLGVVSDFTAFAKTGKVRMYVPPARVQKVREMIAAAIQQGELLRVSYHLETRARCAASFNFA